MESNADHHTITLDFHGPFKFTTGESYLFYSKFVESEGIYIWTIKDEVHNLNLIHYIGETTEFGNQHKEQFLWMSGLYSRIIDPDSAKRGVEKILWKGMRRDRTPEAVGNVMDSYDAVTRSVREYIGLINVYFAPTNLAIGVRKHIEGCIGWNLRRTHPEFKMLYPGDIHLWTNAERLGQRLIVNLPEAIAGIDKELMI